MRVFSRALLIIVCLHLLGESIGQLETCEPAECWNCSAATQSLSTSHNCSEVWKYCMKKEFNVTLYISPSVVEEGMTVNVNCTHNIPNGSISWLQSNELQEEKKEILQIKYILKTSVVNCSVNSVCGNYNSGFTIEVKANNMVVLLICVGAAAGVLMLFAVVMKITLKRGQDSGQEDTEAAEPGKHPQHCEHRHQLLLRESLSTAEAPDSQPFQF
ncbi:uncharacterized protein LOC127176326 isoform X2 [Labeo rohita]|uniref:uncharacterized protein LOC127176326 isoform X2 n=1 Tax=Labeo rohita TaxID=84645 RepID=UPI0021E28FAE|nr:uncharacterized protein LOC127176326 isoform X2 [Labeo rohita]